MTIATIPTSTTDSNYEQVASLSGVTYVLRFLWNARAQRWFLTLRDASGVDLVTARKCCADIPFAAHESISGLPDGNVWVVDLTGRGGDPGLREFGERVLLRYAT